MRIFARHKPYAQDVVHNLNMKYSLKILLSLPSIIGLVFLITILIPGLKNWVNQNVTATSKIGIYIIGLGIIQFVLLTIRVWSFKNISRNKKGEETFYLFSFNYFAALNYIWKTDREFVKMEKTMHNNV